MRAVTDTGPEVDQDGITTVTVIDDISITVNDRPGPILLIGIIGYIDTDTLAVVHTARILQEGTPIADATVSRETGAVDNIAGVATMVAFVENVAIGQTFTMDIATAGTGLDVKVNNAKLIAIALPRDSAQVAGLVSP